MKKILVIFFIFFGVVGCERQDKLQFSTSTDMEPGIASVITDYIMIEVGQNLEPFLGKKIQVIGEVSNTKYPSLGNYWLTAFGLEDHRGEKVHVWGIVRLVTESTNGGMRQGRDGVFCHLYVQGYKVVE